MTPRAGRAPSLTAKVAAALGVSERMVHRACAIQRDAPDLVPLIEAGSLSLGAAERVLCRRTLAPPAALPTCELLRIEAGELRRRAASLRRQADKLDQRAAEMLAAASVDAVGATGGG